MERPEIEYSQRIEPGLFTGDKTDYYVVLKQDVFDKVLKYMDYQQSQLEKEKEQSMNLLGLIRLL